MKRLVLNVSMALLTSFCADSQVSINVNISKQPIWGPAGYDRADYYYLPDIAVYYNVRTKQYVSREGNRWISGADPPARYKNFDLYKNYKVVLNEKEPWLKDEQFRRQYRIFLNRHDQDIIRDNPGQLLPFKTGGH